MQPRKTEAIILRRTNYGEADRVISFLTPHMGKLSAIAKGVRRPKSKLAGGLELFAISDITLVAGRGELGIVTSARMQQFFGNILHDYDRMQLGYEIVKEINRATETIGEPEFYQLLRDSLTYLDDLKIDSQLIELWFRLQLVLLLGHGINLTTDRDGKKLRPGEHYAYDSSEHALYPLAQGTMGEEHIKLLRLASSRAPAVLAHISGLEIVLPECLYVARQL